MKYQNVISLLHWNWHDEFISKLILMIESNSYRLNQKFKMATNIVVMPYRIHNVLILDLEWHVIPLFALKLAWWIHFQAYFDDWS